MVGRRPSVVTAVNCSHPKVYLFGASCLICHPAPVEWYLLTAFLAYSHQIAAGLPMVANRPDLLLLSLDRLMDLMKGERTDLKQQGLRQIQADCLPAALKLWGDLHSKEVVLLEVRQLKKLPGLLRATVNLVHAKANCASKRRPVPDCLRRRQRRYRLLPVARLVVLLAVHRRGVNLRSQHRIAAPETLRQGLFEARVLDRFDHRLMALGEPRVAPNSLIRANLFVPSLNCQMV